MFIVRWPLFKAATLPILGLLSVSLLPAGLLWSVTASAFEDEALWLPVSYRKLAPELRRAAFKTEATERCVKLLRGRLHDSSRGLEQAFFLLVCRDEQNTTYPILADANTLELTYREIVKPEPEPEPEPGLEALLAERIEACRQQCEALWLKKTRFMRNMQRLSDDIVEPEIDDVALTFVVDFDADSLSGKRLRYRARCHVADEETAATLKIRGRQL